PPHRPPVDRASRGRARGAEPRSQAVAGRPASSRFLVTFDLLGHIAPESFALLLPPGVGALIQRNLNLFGSLDHPLERGFVGLHVSTISNVRSRTAGNHFGRNGLGVPE